MIVVKWPKVDVTPYLCEGMTNWSTLLDALPARPVMMHYPPRLRETYRDWLYRVAREIVDALEGTDNSTADIIREALGQEVLEKLREMRRQRR